MGNRLTGGGPIQTRWLRSETGSALLFSILILGVITMLGTSLVMNSMNDRQISAYHWEKTQALAAAETGVAYATRLIQDRTAPLGDSDKDGRPDFEISDTLKSGASYRALAETIDARALDSSAYLTDAFVIVAEGCRGHAVRRVAVRLVHDTFLKFARFVANGSTSFECGTAVSGDVYMLGEMTLPTDCAGHPVQFLEPVYVQTTINNPEDGVFQRGYHTDVTPIDLQDSIDINALRDRARGLLMTCDCEGRGEVGIFCDLAAAEFPFLSAGGGAMAAMGGPLPAITELDLGLFDFYDTDAAPGETLVTFSNYRLVNPLTGQALTSGEFNGLVFCEGDAQVKGTLDGKSGRSLTIVASDDVVVRGNIVTGHTGYDPATGAADGTGDPVNLALIAYDYVIIDRATPRVLRIDAALMARQNSWLCEGSAAEHPAVVAAALDLDLDGVTGESPRNDDPYAGCGWDERSITSATWVLNLTGPLITQTAGSSGVWTNATLMAASPGPTRRRNYDLDIQAFPPPCFPKPVNLWREESWAEIRESERDLATYLPA